MSNQPRFAVYAMTKSFSFFPNSYVINTPNDLARMVNLETLKEFHKNGTINTRNYSMIPVEKYLLNKYEGAVRPKEFLGYFREIREVIDFIQMWEMLDV